MKFLRNKGKHLRVVFGLAAGVVLSVLWVQHYGDQLKAPRQLSVGLLAAVLAVFAMCLMLHVLRVTFLLGIPARRGFRPLVRPVVAAFAVSVLGATLAGDASEVYFLTRATGLPPGRVIRVMLHRMSVTFFALGAVSVIALCIAGHPAMAAIASAAMIAPFVARPVIDFVATHRIPLLTWGEGALGNDPAPLDRRLHIHLPLALVETFCDALTLAIVGEAIGEPLPFEAWLGTSAVILIVTYVPVPLSALGIYHWTFVGVATFLAPSLAPPVLAAAIQHAMRILVGSLCAGVAVFLPRVQADTDHPTSKPAPPFGKAPKPS